MVLLRLTYKTEYKPKLSDLSALLYNYELLYDYLVLSTMKEYSSYTFPPIFWYRARSPLASEERMQISSIHYGSPLIIIVGIISRVAKEIILPIIHISGEIADWSPNRRKVKADAAIAELKVIEKSADIKYKQMRIRHGELIVEQEEYRTEMTRMELEELHRQRKIRQETALRRLKQRLSETPYQLDDITIESEEEKLD